MYKCVKWIMKTNHDNLMPRAVNFNGIIKVCTKEARYPFSF
jgi:hypothetical protein